MGFLRKTFKKIGRGIKKAFMKFGKFMGKIGVLGQVAMMFILPGIGAALMKGVTGAFGAIVGQTATQATAAAAGSAAAATASTTAAASATAAGATASAAAAAGAAAGATASAAAAASTTAAISAGTFSGTMVAGTGLLGSTATGAAGALARGTGQLLSYVGKAASMPGKVFSSVTQGVTKTLGEFSKTALSKVPGLKGSAFGTKIGLDNASSHFFAGSESAFAKGADVFAAPFSEKAAARVLENKAATAFSKEGLTYDTEQLLKGVEKVNSPEITSTSTIPKIESLTADENTRLSKIMETPLTEKQTSRLEVIKQEASDSLLAPKPTAVIDEALPKEQYSALGDVGNQFVEDVMDVGENAFTEARETVTGKLSNLSDPAKAIPALAKTAVGSYEDAQYAARANERAPEVIDLGQSQDFRDFQASDQGFFQNSAIGPYQLQNANTYTPQSSWAQQQMLMLQQQQQQQQGVYS